MEPQNRLNKKIGIVLGVAVIFVVAGVTIFSEMNSASAPIAASIQNPPADTSTVSVPTSTPASTPTPLPVSTTTPPPIDNPKPVTTSVYKNGTYSATGSYMSPGGDDQIAVTLTLANDIITDVSVTPSAGDGTSRRYQNRFVSGYKQYVVGKNIADVQLTSVSGSSLTPIGFNEALTQIKAQAKA